MQTFVIDIRKGPKKYSNFPKRYCKLHNISMNATIWELVFEIPVFFDYNNEWFPWICRNEFFSHCQLGESCGTETT